MKVALCVLGFIVFVGALMGGAVLLTRRSTSAANHIQGPPMPDVTVMREGQRVALAGPRQAPLLLHLWATWCGPCREELPSLLAFQGKSAAEVMAVSVDDEYQSVLGFFSGKPPPAIAWDHKIQLERALDVPTIPTTFLVDTQGNVVARWNGAQQWDESKSREIEAALQ